MHLLESSDFPKYVFPSFWWFVDLFRRDSEIRRQLVIARGLRLEIGKKSASEFRSWRDTAWFVTSDMFRKRG